MFSRACCTMLLGLTLAAAPGANSQDKKYAIKTANGDPPAQLQEPVRKLLSKDVVQFFEPGGGLVCELWFCNALPSDATAEQVKNGLTYRELKETQIIGAVRVHRDWVDYRRQKVRAGVYTMRLAIQPADGDHQGKSLFTEFVLLSAAAHDTKPDVMTYKNLTDMSMKSIDTGHPAVLMLFPNEKPGKPALESRPREHWVLNLGCSVQTAGGRATLGFGLTLVGEADD